MKNLLRVSVLSLIFAFLFTMGIGDFTDSHAWEKKQRRNPTKSGIKATGQAKKESGMARWNSLSPEQQEYMKQRARAAASKAKASGEEYWNSLSPDEQQEALVRAKAAMKKGRKRWQSLPE